MPRYQVTAHIYVTGEHENDDDLLKAVRFEIDAGSLFLAHDDAIVKLRAQYPDMTIAVTAEELCP